ncbi:unnamed protein product, partial [marine sediment metagenome]
HIRHEFEEKFYVMWMMMNVALYLIAYVAVQHL